MKNEKNIKIQKLKERLINFFKNPREVISFFLPIVITISLIMPMPYYVKMGGGTINLNDEISVDGEKEETGSLEALYVREAKAIVLTYLLSYVVPSFEKEEIEDTVINEEDEDSYNYRERLYFTSSLDAATKVAFEKAGKKVEVSSSKFLVIYIDKSSKTNLEIGDEILKIEDEEVDSYDEIANLIAKNKDKDKIKITVERDNKQIDTFNELITIEKEQKLGVVISNEIKYKSDPEVVFDFNGRQAGPSGGLMIALTIYNKLTDEDITGGKKIVGTGTIDTSGNVGEIGGIKHKLMAADSKNADVVFVPKDNYNEAKELKEKENYDFELVSVSIFDDALEYLNK